MEDVRTVNNGAEHKKMKKEEKEPVEEPVASPPTPRIPKATNTRALPKDALTYELQKFPKNAMLIFKQTSIDGYEMKFCNRDDEEKLKQTFKYFGFEVIVREDMTKDEITEELHEFCGKNYTDYGCVAVVVLTIGSNDGLIKAKDEDYSEFEIINHFNVESNPTLVTKPKILIIQARRDIAEKYGSTVPDIDEEIESYSLPMESDILVVHSSYIGHQATGHPRQGTWFIENLCDKIQQLSPQNDLECILDELKLNIEELQEHDMHLRMPATMSTLIRKLHLKRFGDDSEVAVASSPIDLAVANNKDLNDDVVMEVAEDIAPCACFLEHFDYIKKCLGHYIEENPEDDTARRLFGEANDLREGEASKKERKLAEITRHLQEETSGSEYSMCIHFYMDHLCDEDHN